MILRKNPNVSLKLRYPIAVRVSTLISVLMLITILVAFPRFKTKEFLEKQIQIEIEQFDIPQTQQFDLPPPPSRPSIPVESENEDLADDVTIEETELEDFVEWDAPPPPPDEGPRVRFIPYDDPPVPIGGYGAIQRNIIYPEIAQEAGIEGTVVISFWVDETGMVDQSSIEILQSIPCLDQVCINEIKKSKWRPARQGRQKVGVPLSMPFNFTLEN